MADLQTPLDGAIVRIYGRGIEALPDDQNRTQDQFSKIHECLGEWSGPGAHPATPYILSARGNTRTAAMLPLAAWQALFAKLSLRPIGGWDVHHLIPATMLTHAVAQGDL